MHTAHSVIVYLWKHLLEYLFPRTENIREVELLSPEEMRDQFPPADTIFKTDFHALFSYKNELVRAVIWQIKYNKNTTLIKNIGALLAEEALALIQEKLLSNEILLLPIPIHPQRRQERGYNQCELLAKALINAGTSSTLRYTPEILSKTKDTSRQSRTKNKQQRLHNIHNSFVCDYPEKVRGKTILLLDDVITTGTTMREASNMLRKAGATHIICLAIAH